MTALKSIIDFLKTYYAAFMSMLSVLTAICMTIITYQQYSIQKLSQEPFFNVKIETLADESDPEYFCPIYETNVIIFNGGEHARSIDIQLYSILKVSDGKKVYSIPIDFFLGPLDSYNTKGIIRTYKGLNNSQKLSDAVSKGFGRSKNKRMSYHAISIDHYVSIAYSNMAGKMSAIFFKNGEVLESIPNEVIMSSNTRHFLDINSLTMEEVEKYIEDGHFFTLPERSKPPLAVASPPDSIQLSSTQREF